MVRTIVEQRNPDWEHDCNASLYKEIDSLPGTKKGVLARRYKARAQNSEPGEYRILLVGYGNSTIDMVYL